MAGKRSLVRQGKVWIVWLLIGLGVAFINPGDCFGAGLVWGINQGGQQLERVNGDLPEIAEAAEEENVEGEMDWEEEFTDTDTRRGILAVRGAVFQGFGGRVRVVVKEMEGGRETVILLAGEEGYMANQELRPGRYQVVAVEADSDGRKFDCHVEAEEMEVDTDRVRMCRVFVGPGSVYQVIYEAEDEMRGMKSGDESMEQTLEAAEGTVDRNGRTESGVREGEFYLEGQQGIPMVLLIAFLGIAVSFYGAVWVIRGHHK